MPPNRLVQEQLETTIAGVNLTLIHAPGETSDIIFAWLPEKKAIIQIGNFYKSFPAMVTLREASFRNPLDYLQSLDKMRSLNAEYLVMIHSGAPIRGAEEIKRHLTNFRDAVQFVHDQTIQNMNKGLTPGEIIEIVKGLPPHLAGDPYVQEYFGKIDRDIFQIFLQYMGWFTGKCRDLFPMSPTQKAAEMAELAGGVTQLTAKAQNALSQGKLEWALILADYVLLLRPEDAEARTIKKSAMLSLAEETYNAQSRNYLLSEYLEDTGRMSWHTQFSMIDDNMMTHMPMYTLFGIMQVGLNASKYLEMDILAGLRLPDLNADYSLHVRRGIEEVQAGMPNSPLFTIVAPSLVWKQLVLGKLYPQDAVERGYVAINGAAPQTFYNFMALFDLPAVSFNYSPHPPVANRSILFEYEQSSVPTGEIVSWKWDFGDGSDVQEGESVTHTYASPGTYKVTCTITDDQTNAQRGQHFTSRVLEVLPIYR